ncbi:hypothetical protein RclHR1_02890014 [Rhizophagus clarus]|uniref:HMG box domain-containing protein n=1 Tax=Rhizophagus clarus TaxID=94130 RepID=A0A2Z6R3L7_9GLOM|nr:hypothetical protein RclHR1_02890014 [Rhizophagus clarus]GES98035.1 hypothetical protein GLOIN_2v1473413 [Rhizophagus clarus]
MPKINQSQVPDMSEFRLIFPPTITPHEIISDKKKKGKKPKKPPNAFIIYRKVYSGELAKNNYRLKQKEISSLCSKSWRNEPEYVKKHYRRLAHDTDKIFLQDSQNDTQLPQPFPPQHEFQSSELLQSEMNKYLSRFDDIERLQETQNHNCEDIQIQQVVPITYDVTNANQQLYYPYYPHYPFYEPTDLTFFEENY